MLEPSVIDVMISLAPLTAEDMNTKSSGILVATASKIKAMVNSETLKEGAAWERYLTAKRSEKMRVAKETIRMTKQVFIVNIVIC